MSDTMVDQVIDAIAHNPLSHAADEDIDAAVMPDFFEGPLRRLLLRLRARSQRSRCRAL